MKRRRLSGAGFEFAAAVAGFALIGYWIGGYYGNATWGLVIGALLGIFGAMYNLIRAALRSKEDGSGDSDPQDKSEP